MRARPAAPQPPEDRRDGEAGGQADRPLPSRRGPPPGEGLPVAGGVAARVPDRRRSAVAGLSCRFLGCRAYARQAARSCAEPGWALRAKNAPDPTTNPPWRCTILVAGRSAKL